MKNYQFLLIMAMFHIVLARISAVTEHDFGVFIGTVFALLFIILSIKELYDHRGA